MYRGSAADFLALQGFRANPGIPPQMPQKGDSRHLVDFLWLSSMSKVVLFRECSSRGLGGLLSKVAVSEAISGSRAVHTCCCSYCCMAGDLARADQASSRKYIATREISTCRGRKSAVFTMCYASAYLAIAQSTCTELARGPWVTGGV